MTIIKTLQLGHPWQTLDPFLFCVHHLDQYPSGNQNMGIDRQHLSQRQLGMDFSGKDGWSMYHGQEVPGFPPHPHRGFETVTIARQGYIDHADSMGARARFGQGDVQWMTAGRGIMHSEMFPLVKSDAPNPTELFQIWLNLPAANKMVDPYFTMFWHEQVPVVTQTSDQHDTATITCIAGHLDGVEALSPPPDSWAARDNAHVGIFTITLEPGSSIALPGAPAGVNRAVYFFEGDHLQLNTHSFEQPVGLQVEATETLNLQNHGTQIAQLLILQGRPINEPVVQHGPFVMNTTGQIRQAMIDYQTTQFGGWRHDSTQPVWPRAQGRFAQHADGRQETP